VLSREKIIGSPSDGDKSIDPNKPRSKGSAVETAILVISRRSGLRPCIAIALSGAP